MAQRRRGIGLIAALGAGLALSSAAQAQGDLTVVPKPFEVKLGAFFPSDSEVRRAGGDSILIVELEYTVQYLIDTNAVTKVGIGILNRDEFRMIPITVSQVFREPGRLSGGRGFYYGGGVGIYVTRLETPETSGKTKNLFGGFVVGGFDINQNLFVEGKYHIVSRYDEKQVDGLQVTVGRRF